MFASTVPLLLLMGTAVSEPPEWKAQGQAWIDRLESARFLSLVERAVGEGWALAIPETGLPDLAALPIEGDPWPDLVREHHRAEVYAVSAMSPTAYSLSIWRGDSPEGEPALELGFDGDSRLISETVRYADGKEVTSTYPAWRSGGVGGTSVPTDFGDPPGVCFCGVLYQTWLGPDTYQVEVYEEHFARSELKAVEELNGVECYVLHEVTYEFDDSTRRDYFWLTTDVENPAVIRWLTVKTMVDEENGHWHVARQDRRYTPIFVDDHVISTERQEPAPEIDP